MTARDKGKKIFAEAKKKTGELAAKAKEQTERSERLGNVAKSTVKAGKTVATKATEVQQKVTEKYKKILGFDKYRVELENALEEALQVIAAQEARIRLLEERPTSR